MQKKKILLAEDHKFIARAYTDGLERAGFDVDLALDGIETIKKLEQEKPDLILLDLIMPMKDGFEVLAELKLSQNLRRIPVIVLSNLSQEPDIQKVKDLGAQDYLVKSELSLHEVIEKVKYHLAKKSLNKEKTNRDIASPKQNGGF